jgi:DNA-binding NarL/FixJ family response regulator
LVLTDADKERLRLARLSLPHRHYTGDLNAGDVIEVFEMYASGMGKHEIAKSKNVRMESIHRILIRKSWWLIEIPESLLDKCRNRLTLEHGRPGIRSRTSKLTEKDAREIKEQLASGQDPKAIALLYNVSPATIRAIRNGRTFRWVVYPDVPNTAS